MTEFENGHCTCKDCERKRAKLQKQLDHPFYKKVDEFRNDIKLETLKKAAEKYKEPFNPASWTVEQLAKHAMAENYDQSNYIYGMFERMQELEKLLVELANTTSADIEKYRNRCRDYEKKINGLHCENEKIKFAVAENCELRRQIERLQAIEHLYNLEMGKQSELVEYLQKEFKNVGQPGDHCVDFAIAALVQEKNAVNFWRGQYLNLKGDPNGTLGGVIDGKA